MKSRRQKIENWNRSRQHIILPSHYIECLMRESTCGRSQSRWCFFAAALRGCETRLCDPKLFAKSAGPASVRSYTRYGNHTNSLKALETTQTRRLPLYKRLVIELQQALGYRDLFDRKDGYFQLFSDKIIKKLAIKKGSTSLEIESQFFVLLGSKMDVWSMFGHFQPTFYMRTISKCKYGWDHLDKTFSSIRYCPFGVN